MGTTATNTASRGKSKSPPKRPSKSPPKSGAASHAKTDSSSKTEASIVVEPAEPLAPPPRPNGPQQQQQQDTNTPDYFTNADLSGSLNLEPNPFEQSFGGGGPQTPGGTKLPSVAALTSPSSLLPGTTVTPFAWGGGSLRTGPLSPAMLSGPQGDYFGDTHHLRGGFPTPNESSLRSGLTPGGSGSMFPAPSPNSQALYAQLASGGATPSTLDFHRTAMNVAAKRDQPAATQSQQSQTQHQQQHPQHQQHQQQQSVTSQPQDMPNGATTVKSESKPASGPFDPHDNDAANGLFLLAQGRNGAPQSNQYAPAPGATTHAHPAPPAARNQNGSPQMSNLNGGGSVASARGVSEASMMSDDSEMVKPNTRGKGKRNASAMTSTGQKGENNSAKSTPYKKVKSFEDAMDDGDMDMMSDDDMPLDENGNKPKMTDEEKRKNFLERNRVAALKCRQRKKQWLANLQTKVEMFSSENDALTSQITQLREEVVNLKTLLLAHKDCPVTHQQGLHGAYMAQVVEPYNGQMNPYGMAGQMQNQQVMAGQGGIGKAGYLLPDAGGARHRAFLRKIDERIKQQEQQRLLPRGRPKKRRKKQEEEEEEEEVEEEEEEQAVEQEEQQGQHSGQHSGEQQAAQQDEQQRQQSGEQQGEQQELQPWEQPLEQLGEQPWDQSGEQSWDQSGEQSWDQSGEQPWEHPELQQGLLVQQELQQKLYQELQGLHHEFQGLQQGYLEGVQHGCLQGPSQGLQQESHQEFPQGVQQGLQQGLHQQDLFQQDLHQEALHQPAMQQHDLHQQGLLQPDFQQGLLPELQTDSHQEVPEGLELENQQGLYHQDFFQQELDQQDLSQQDLSPQGLFHQDPSQQDLSQQRLFQQELPQQEVQQLQEQKSDVATTEFAALLDDDSSMEFTEG